MSEKKKKPAEEKNLDEILDTSRRDFLKKVGLVGSAALTGAAALYSGYRFEKEKHSGATIKVLTEDNRLVEIPVEQVKDYKPGLKVYQTRGREGIEGKRWVMVIDLSKCRNARKCVEACQDAHHLRPYEYHINTLVMQESKNTPRYFMPKPCQHCDNPPCVSVCPVDATFKRQDGIVLIDNERCIGCRFCMSACPYSARMFHWQEPLAVEGDKERVYDIELNVPHKKGTISKCLFSADRLREGIMPYCVSACPNGVFYFGDENEDAVTNGTTKETVRLSELLEQNGAYRLLPELGTKPRVYYLPPKNRIFEFREPGETEYKEQHNT
ncbi:MAG: 4Fe-4S dicluster domain-containing protein [Bacteroidales bacterium]|jgi:molybdopterin-containing oxidoreductase family iron-sulfur binding subunit|nr:4Fe-4S dicluster domain-containing protein [Bacteroidales bacterium]MCU0407331.1 4Fe-4S dicluster domain-containing protein [Bacteroidales bacterium]